MLPLIKECEIAVLFHPYSVVTWTDLDFHANLTSVSAIQSITANLTTTFRFTATAELNGTVVLCFAVTVSGTPTASQSLTVAGD